MLESTLDIIKLRVSSAGSVCSFEALHKPILSVGDGKPNCAVYSCYLSTCRLYRVVERVSPSPDN